MTATTDSSTAATNPKASGRAWGAEIYIDPPGKSSTSPDIWNDIIKCFDEHIHNTADLPKLIKHQAIAGREYKGGPVVRFANQILYDIRKGTSTLRLERLNEPKRFACIIPKPDSANLAIDTPIIRWYEILKFADSNGDALETPDGRLLNLVFYHE